MKKITAVMLLFCMLAAFVPLGAAAYEPDNLIENGGFEIYDENTLFPADWMSDGQNLLENGDFETGTLSAGYNLPETKDMKYEKYGAAGLVEAAVNSPEDNEQFGEYSMKITWNGSAITWGGAGVNNADGVLPLAYGSTYIYRGYAKAETAGQFGSKVIQFNALYNYEPTDHPASESNWQVGTEWREYTKEFSTKDYSSSYPSAAAATRFQFRVNGSASPNAVLYADNLSVEKLGRTTDEAVFRGERALKFVGYADGANEDWKSSPVRVYTGSEYEITYYTAGSNGRASLLDENGNDKQLVFNSEENGAWTKRTARFKAEADEEVYLSLGAGEDDVAYFDDVSMTEVPSPASVVLEAADGESYINLEASNTKQLRAQVLDRLGNVLEDEAVIFGIKDNTEGFSIDENGLLTVESGTSYGIYVTVTASSVTNPEVVGELRLVTAGAESLPIEVEVSGKTAFNTLTDNKFTEEKYSAAVIDQFGKDISAESDIEWIADESSTTQNIIIDSSGTVRVLENSREGTLVIRAAASLNGVTKLSEPFEIAVTQSLEGIALQVSAAAVALNSERSVGVIFTPENVKNKKFTVKSSDSTVVSAAASSGSVILTAKKAGEAVVTVCSDEGNFTAEMTVIVVEPQAGDVDLTFENNGAGWSHTSYNVIPNGDFEEDLYWSSTGSSSGRADSGYTTDNVYEGRRSAVISYGPGILSNQWSAFRNSAVYQINPESTYRVSMAVDIPSIEAGQRANLNFKITDKALNTIVAEDPDIIRATSKTDGWEIKSADYKVPADGSQISLFGARTQGQAGFTAYFDNLEFSTIAGVCDTESYEGSHSMRVGAYGELHGADAQKAYSDNIEVTGGKTYTVSGAVKTDSSAKGALGLVFRDESGAVLAESECEPALNPSWQTVSHTATAPEGATSMSIELISSGTGFAYFDNLSYLEEISVPSAVVIEGGANIAIPAVSNVEKTYGTYVTDQFGVRIPKLSAALSLGGSYPGVTLSGNILKISSSASEGSIILKAAGEGYSSQKTVKLVKVLSTAISGAPQSISQPGVETIMVLTLNVDFRSGAIALPEEESIFTLGDAYSGVSISGNNLIIQPTVKAGTITVNGEWAEDPNVNAKAYITIKPQSSQSGSASSSGGGGGGGGSSGISYLPGTPENPLEVILPEGTQNTPVSFTDVDSSHWAYEAIKKFGESGLISGRGNNRFVPEDMITRAEFATMLVRVLGIDTLNELVGFSDVYETAWYYPYVATAYKYGIVTGYPDGTFGVDRLITKEEAAVMLERAVKSLEIRLPSGEASSEGFADQGDISEFARASIAALRQAGILNGDENGRMNPGKNASRAETVWMLYRIYLNK